MKILFLCNKAKAAAKNALTLYDDAVYEIHWYEIRIRFKHHKMCFENQQEGNGPIETFGANECRFESYGHIEDIALTCRRTILQGREKSSC